jgi:hypothetical protein
LCGTGHATVGANDVKWNVSVRAILGLLSFVATAGAQADCDHDQERRPLDPGLGTQPPDQHASNFRAFNQGCNLFVQGSRRSAEFSLFDRA